MSWPKAKLGDICRIEKGLTGINKAIPGVYPMVVTSEERKSHNEFQFDDSAVIIPLVSSTGHGHKSLKRIHFQQGKFALGSILCAVIPTDKTMLNAEYLYRYLDLNRENELVARMKGMANVTLPMKEIAQIEIPIPPIENQIEFTNYYHHLEEYSGLVSGQLADQLDLLKKLRQQILQDAVQGKLVPQDPKDEPASVLLEKIRAEKAQLVREKKIKPEKPLLAIKAEEVPFEIPGSWAWCRLGAIVQLVTSGSRDWAKFYSAHGSKYIRMGNLSKESFSLRMDKIQHVMPPKNQEGDRTKLEAGDILVSITGDVGNLGLIPINFGEAYINQHTALVRLNYNIVVKYICHLFLSEMMQRQFNAPQRGMKNSFRLSDIDYLLVPLPPMQEQHRIVTKADQLMTLCNELEQSIRQNQEYTQKLLQVALKEALEPG
jgi:type I restriction enzyme, S subunit